MIINVKKKIIIILQNIINSTLVLSKLFYIEIHMKVYDIRNIIIYKYTIL